MSDEIDRILRKKNEPSSDEHGEIFDAIYQKLKAGGEVGQKRAWRLPVFFAFAVAAAGLLLFMVGDDFAPRGEKSEVTLELACSGGCKRGSQVTLTLEAPSPYFSAFSVAPDGTVIWYFENVPVAPGRHALDRAIALGPEHTLGAHELHGIFSERTLSRAEIKAASGVKREFTVLP